MVAYKNFYETIHEARMRLCKTIVKYKDDFFYVIAVGDHKPDGKFRIYMDPVGYGRVASDRLPDFPHNLHSELHDSYVQYDQFIDNNPDSGFTRKYADSKHFNSFRPFPLGNVNTKGSAIYTERTPTRNMHQGLLSEAIMATKVESVPIRYDPRSNRATIAEGPQEPINNSYCEWFGPEFYDMLRGTYPTYKDVVKNLRDPEVMNKGCAFNRDYSVLRGPLDTLILCYKNNGVGLIRDDDSLFLGSSDEYLKEEIEELNVFKNVEIKKVNSYD